MFRLKLTKWPGVSITILFLLSIVLFFVVGTQLCLANRSGESKTASVLLQEALYAEEIEGDINAAIKIYQQIIDELNLNNHVLVYLEYIPSNQVYKFFETADLAIFPYRQFDSQSGVGATAVSFRK